MSDVDVIVVEKEDVSERLDIFLTHHFPDFSRNYFQKLLSKNLVTVNGQLVKKRTKLELGDEVEVNFIFDDPIQAIPEEIPLEIIYEDKDILAINKPSGMVVHPAPGHPKGTFVNALLHYLKNSPTSDQVRPGVVHRLDKETSGVLLAAKNEKAHSALVALFAERKIKKTYLAVATGHVKPQTINKPIRRSRRNRQKMTISDEGKEAITVVAPLDLLSDVCTLEVQILTGRTHQIRVHLQSIHHPVLGDSVYGIKSINEKHKITRQLLHAFRLEFIHPITNKEVVIQAELPEDMHKFFTTMPS